MKGYQKMTVKDFLNIPLIIPTDILYKYTDERILKIIEKGTKIFVKLEDGKLVSIQEYKKINNEI